MARLPCAPVGIRADGYGEYLSPQENGVEGQHNCRLVRQDDCDATTEMFTIILKIGEF